MNSGCMSCDAEMDVSATISRSPAEARSRRGRSTGPDEAGVRLSSTLSRSGTGEVVGQNIQQPLECVVGSDGVGDPAAIADGGSGLLAETGDGRPRLALHHGVCS